MKKIFILLLVLVVNQTIAQDDFQMKFENSDSLDKFIHQHELSYKAEDIFIFKDLESFKEYSSQGYLMSPVIFVFNANGDYVDIVNNVNAEKKLSNFKKIRKKRSKDFPDLDFWEQKIAHYKSGEEVKEADKTNYTFVLSWGIFYHKARYVKTIDEWYNVLLRQRAAGEHIDLILLNTDLQESWNLSAEMTEWVLDQVNNNKVNNNK